MICPICKAETDGVNHNNRGLRCTSCWELLPDESPSEARAQVLATDAHFNRVMLPEQKPVSATARAQALAAARGIDLTTVTGTGKGGRITVGDVREAMR